MKLGYVPSVPCLTGVHVNTKVNFKFNTTPQAGTAPQLQLTSDAPPPNRSGVSVNLSFTLWKVLIAIGLVVLAWFLIRGLQ